MDVNSLLDQAKEACGVSYDKDLAPRLGVRPSAISNYRKGVSHPDAVVCATLAGLTGVPLARVLGVIGEARAISREEKAVWRKLAATAMALCLAVGFALPRDAHAAMPTAFDVAPSIHYAKCDIAGTRSAAGPLSSVLLGNGYGSGSALACLFVPPTRTSSQHDQD
jgi:transcriptional regulator with XRE-family HTH domain